MYHTQTAEERLEPSELDLLSFDITRSDLDAAASDLACTHLGEPDGLEPTGGLIYSVKDRVRTVQKRGKKLSVAFILDTGAPVTYVSYETARAFGVDPGVQGGNHVRATFEGDVTLEVHFFHPNGPHNKLNVLGMDYLMAKNCQLKIHRRSRTVTLLSE